MVMATIRDSMNDDFRMYLEEKFKNVHVSLDSIKVQAEKNEQITQGIIRTMNQMTLAATIHIQECPNTKEIEVVKDTLQEFEFFKKYKNAFFTYVAVTILGLLIIIFEGYMKIKDYSQKEVKVKTEEKK